MDKKLRGCKNPTECSTTTNIAGQINHGWGKCDDNGFWEYPCEECDRYEQAVERLHHGFNAKALSYLLDIWGATYYIEIKDQVIKGQEEKLERRMVVNMSGRYEDAPAELIANIGALEHLIASLGKVRDAMEFLGLNATEITKSICMLISMHDRYKEYRNGKIQDDKHCGKNCACRGNS